MPVHIGNVSADIRTTPSAAPAPAAGGGASSSASAATERELRDRLRSIVMDILQNELQELRRRRG